MFTNDVKMTGHKVLREHAQLNSVQNVYLGLFMF